MENVIKGLIGVAVLGLLAAVIGTVFFGGFFMDMPSEAYARASSNCALIAIALAVGWKGAPATG